MFILLKSGDVAEMFSAAVKRYEEKTGNPVTLCYSLPATYYKFLDDIKDAYPNITFLFDDVMLTRHFVLAHHESEWGSKPEPRLRYSENGQS